MSSADLSGLLSGDASGPPTTPLTLQEAACWTGRLRWVELALFERIGRRAALFEPAGVAVWAEGASLAAAWRASLLAELLPVSVGLPSAAELTLPASPAVELALDRIGLPADQSGSPARVDVLDGRGLVEHMAAAFYPALLGAYEARGAAASPASDGPVLRALARLTADLRVELNSAAEIAERACRPA